MLVAGRDGARGKCLWAGQAEAPGGHVTPSLSQVGWLTGLAPQSCFNEKPRGLSARGPRVGTEARKSLDREQLLSCWILGLISSWSVPYNSPTDVPGSLPNPPGSPYAPTQLPRLAAAPQLSGRAGRQGTWGQQPGYRHSAAKAPAQARIWSSSSGAGCPVPPHRRQASAQAVSRTSSHLSLGWEPTSFWGGSAQGGPWRWPPAALEGCRGTFQKPQDPSDAGQRFTFHARRPVLGLHPPWPPVPCRGAGPGGLRPRCRRLSEAVLQALERGASLGASCENPTLAVLAGQSSVL